MAIAVEGQLITESGPKAVQFTYTNITSAGLSIPKKEIFAIVGASGKRTAAVMFASTQTDTIGTLAVGETGQVYIEGRFRVPKDTAVSFLQGEKVYWDASTNKASNSATASTMDDFVLGRAAEVGATASDTLVIDLNRGDGAYELGSSSSSN